jgi:hypothetical protein
MLPWTQTSFGNVSFLKENYMHTSTLAKVPLFVPLGFADILVPVFLGSGGSWRAKTWYPGPSPAARKAPHHGPTAASKGSKGCNQVSWSFSSGMCAPLTGKWQTVRGSGCSLPSWARGLKYGQRVPEKESVKVKMWEPSDTLKKASFPAS